MENLTCNEVVGLTVWEWESVSHNGNCQEVNVQFPILQQCSLRFPVLEHLQLQYYGFLYSSL